MDPLVLLGAAIAVIALFWYKIRHSNDLFVIRVESGKLRLTSGRVPQTLFGDFGDVLRRSQASGTLRAVVENQAPRLFASGEFSDGETQQLKNVLGTYSLARIKAGSRRA